MTRIRIQVTQGLISTQSSLLKGLFQEQRFLTTLLYTKETKATSNTDSCFTVHLLHLKSNFCKLLHTRLQPFKQKDLSFSYSLIWVNKGHLRLHAFVRGATLKQSSVLCETRDHSYSQNSRVTREQYQTGSSAAHNITKAYLIFITLSEFTQHHDLNLKISQIKVMAVSLVTHSDMGLHLLFSYT